MEIPKSLQNEIHSVQNKLKNAIQNHQVYVGKLNDDPNNEELLGQIHDIQEYIISLSKCQKQVVQRLRKEVKLYEAANSDGTKVSIATLLGLNNNNNITNNNETRRNNDSKEIVNGKNFNGLRRTSSKDDYEEGIQNAESPSPTDNCQNNCAKGRESDETDSNEEDILEIAIDNNSIKKRRNSDQISEIELFDQLDFLGSLGLITSDKHTELQNKRAERKRRSTANPQFVYSNWEIPTKRKRHSYLQSNGSAPQTRQTTARLNGPSPPPSKVPGVRPSRSSPPLPKASTKSLIPTQKSSTRPNILRNNPESKLFSGRIKSENGLVQGQAGINVKTVQSVGSKAVHIPGLPSSLTIERIENDSAAVCIHCRNPGSLTVCEICTANFHVSCHVVSFAPSRTCPICVSKGLDQDDSDALSIDLKEEDEIATTSKPSGNVGETGKDSEVNKTTCGFHKVDAAEERAVEPASTVNQLPASTFLIPVAPKSVPSSSSAVDIGQSKNVETTASTVAGDSNSGNSYSSILLNQLSQPPSNQSGVKVSYAYPMPVSSVKPEKSQSYLILRKISESGGTVGRSRSSSFEDQRATSAIFEYQRSSSTGYNDHDQSEIKSIPAVEYSQSSRRQFSGKHKFSGQGFNGEKDATEKATCFNGDKSAGKLHSKLSINQLRPSRQSNAFLSLHSIINDVKALGEPEEPAKALGTGEITALVIPDGEGQPKSNLLDSLFASNNQPHSFPGGFSLAENSGSEQGTELKRDVGEFKDRKSKREPHNGSGHRLQSSSSTNTAEYVKLEEAHLPAPFRPNVVRKSVDAIDAILKKNREKSGDFMASRNRKDAQSRRDHLPAPIRPNLARKSVDAIDALLKKNREKSGKFIGSGNQSGKEMRRNSSDVHSDYTRFEDRHNENLRATVDFIAVERKHSSDHVREEQTKKVYRSEKNMSVYGGSSCVSKTELLHKSLTAALRNKQRLFSNEIKPEFERQDLPINECENNDNGEGTILKARMNAVINALSKENKNKLGINAVSTENMQVLEQFESAMLEVEEDETANC